MDIKNLKFAYTKYGLSNIELASKEFNYFLDINLKIELTYCKGEKVTPYWRKKQNTDLYSLEGYFKGESLEHYNAKMSIVYSKEFLFESENGIVLFKGFTAKSEYKCLIINKTIDAVLLNEDGLPIIGIEIYNTNKKKYKDIIEFNKLNYPIYEYNINEESIEVLHNGDNSIEIFKLRNRIRNANKEIQKITKRINFIEKGFKRLNKKVKKCWSNYYREKEEFDYNIQEKYRRKLEETERIINEIGIAIQGVNQRVRIVKSKIATENRKSINLL